MRGNNKILTVSRDQGLVNFLKMELNGECEVITTSHTGWELKNILEQEQPGFIILDIIMPSLEGIETCLQLRQWTQTPMMMLTTWGAGGNKVRGLNLSSDTYLTEPFGGDTLKLRIEETRAQSEAALAGTIYDVYSRRN